MADIVVEFLRCECGAEWRHSINLLDGKPIWMPPKAKRGAPCQHTPQQVEALVDGRWRKPGEPIEDEEGSDA